MVIGNCDLYRDNKVWGYIKEKMEQISGANNTHPETVGKRGNQSDTRADNAADWRTKRTRGKRKRKEKERACRRRKQRKRRARSEYPHFNFSHAFTSDAARWDEDDEERREVQPALGGIVTGNVGGKK